MGPRQTSQFPPDLEPQYTLIITHQQTKWHTVRSTTVPRPSTKVRYGWLSTSWKSPPKIIEIILPCFVVVQSLGRVSLFGVPRTTACQVFLSFTIAWSLLQLMSIESVMLSNHLTLCYPLLLLPSIFPSLRVFSNESALHIRWPKYWSFNISPSNEYSELIWSRISWDFPGKNIAVGCFTSFSRGSFWPRNSWPLSPALPMNSLPMIHQGNPISTIGNVMGNS